MKDRPAPTESLKNWTTIIWLVMFVLIAVVCGAALSLSRRTSDCESKGGVMVKSFGGYECIEKKRL
jgi:hypothetical protein